MAFTEHGWVQSYGSRYIRPPIIYGDIRRTGDMTVVEFKVSERTTFCMALEAAVESFAFDPATRTSSTPYVDRVCTALLHLVQCTNQHRAACHVLDAVPVVLMD